LDFYSHLAELVGAPPPTFDIQQPTRSGSDGLGKQCVSVQIKETFGLMLRFGNYRIGLADAVARTTLSGT
jgi:hypothetical protein